MRKIAASLLVFGAGAAMPLSAGQKFPFSIIPGGVHSLHPGQEIIHGLAVSRKDFRAYADYRMRDGFVGWTSKAITIHKGEEIVVEHDGSRHRGRCFNRLSPTPQTPTIPPAAEAPIVAGMETPDQSTPEAEVVPPAVAAVPPDVHVAPVATPPEQALNLTAPENTWAVPNLPGGRSGLAGVGPYLAAPILVGALAAIPGAAAATPEPNTGAAMVCAIILAIIGVLVARKQNRK